MHRPITVTVLCGPHDALRLRAAARLAGERTPGKRWALLRTGVLLPAPDDAWPAGVARYDAGVACGCCIGQVALRATLARLLRDAVRSAAAWDALLVDAGAAADPGALCAVLDAAPFAGRFRVARRVVVVDAAAAARLLATPGGARARLIAQLAFADALLVAAGPDAGLDAGPGAGPHGPAAGGPDAAAADAAATDAEATDAAAACAAAACAAILAEAPHLRRIGRLA